MFWGAARLLNQQWQKQKSHHRQTNQLQIAMAMSLNGRIWMSILA